MKIIISCGSKKRAKACPAFLLYQGHYFNHVLNWVKSIAPQKDVYIISAKYGLIHCSQVIEPYEAKMGSKTQIITIEEIKRQFHDLGLENEKMLFCGGKEYMSVLNNSSKNIIRLWDHINLKGKTFGYQMQWLSKNKGQIPEKIKEKMQ